MSITEDIVNKVSFISLTVAKEVFAYFAIRDAWLPQAAVVQQVGPCLLFYAPMLVSADL